MNQTTENTVNKPEPTLTGALVRLLDMFDEAMGINQPDKPRTQEH